MSLHNNRGLALIGAGFEAIYQIAKTRVLDRYPVVDGVKLGDEDGSLHAWHFSRPEAIQCEIYEECHQVAGEYGASFDTAGYLALCRLSHFMGSFIPNDQLVRESLAYRREVSFAEVCNSQELRDKVRKFSEMKAATFSVVTSIPELPVPMKRSHKKKVM